MGDKTGIEWCNHTFNPWIGCTAVSRACDHCYAETLVKRWGGDFAVRRRTAAANWKQPLIWNRKAEAAGKRMRVFCASLADVFDNQVPNEWRDDLFGIILDTPWLDWQLLTKRPQNIMEMLPIMWGSGWPNVWLGTTAEDQNQLSERAWRLSQVPAHTRFLSCEPLLGPINLRRVTNRWGTEWNPLTGQILHAVSGPSTTGAIKWVIGGGESGAGARPMHPDWVRAMRDQCAAAGVPFFFKQWGEWAPDSFLSNMKDEEEESARFIRGKQCHEFDEVTEVWRVGKRAAGSLLDGIEHKAFPA